jgi:Protein of unknown function (DUF3102)
MTAAVTASDPGRHVAAGATVDPVSGAMIAATGFDYAALPAEISVEAKAAADRINGRMRGTMIEVGTDLARVKDMLAHGQFGKWLKAEFGFSERTAERFIGAAAFTVKHDTVSVLQDSTLYLLAAPSTPPLIKQEVVDRLNRGEVLPDRSVKRMIRAAKDELQEEQQRAVLVARAAKVSPRTRRSRAEREEEDRKRDALWKRERVERDAARLHLRNLARDCMGDRLPEFVSLMRVAVPHEREFLALFLDGAP